MMNGRVKGDIIRLRSKRKQIFCLENHLVKRSITNVRVYFLKAIGIVTFPLCYLNGSKPSGSIMLLAVKTNVTWSLHCVHVPYRSPLGFRSVLNFRVATKILFYHNSIAKFISFLFLNAFFINQIL